MYSIGDKVIYNTTGVCEIVNIEKKEFAGIDKEYYVLKPLLQSASTLFIPVDSERLTAKIHRILSKQALLDSIDKALLLSCPLKETETLRQQDFDDIICSGDRIRLIHLIFLLYSHRNAQIQNGKRLHISDSKILKLAENLICEELAFVLEMTKSDADEFILSKLK